MVLGVPARASRRVLAVLGTVCAAFLVGALQAHPARTAGAADIIHRGASLAAPAQSKPVPLVVALHGSGVTPQGFEPVSHLDAVADQNGFVVAYLAWPAEDMSSIVAYISAAIRRIIPAQNIDPNRVYVTGFSAGATISFVAGCQLSSQIAGIAAVSGFMARTAPCKISRPESELLILGTNDIISVNGDSRWLSASDVAAHWQTLNSCAPTSTSSVVGVISSNGWDSCNDASGVGLVVIAGGTHQWPGLGASGADAQYDAANQIWAFFVAHPGSPAKGVSATVTSLAVQRSQLKGSVRAVIDVREANVALRAVVSHSGHVVTSKTFSLARSPNSPVVVSLPRGVSAGRYSVTLTLSDAYGRRTKIVRSVVIPTLSK
jgi:polyhydroxybutyrate depolymerase